MIKSKFNLSNLKKAWYYMKKNGVGDALIAVRERLQPGAYEDYHFEAVSPQELRKQCATKFENPITFSILVPAYNTDPGYLKALLESVCAQSYPYWELILADASTDDRVSRVVKEFSERGKESRIRYIKLHQNGGISANTNEALKWAKGEYVALLDHDDLLTPDALFENAIRIDEVLKKSGNVRILYSDEDKCDESGENYYEVYHKQDFNLDLLLSNNYICHFLVMQKELMQKLQFRCNFDGSQDYDLILRGVSEVLPSEEEIIHIPKVLYHWRCHMGSTAVNPQSKQYAYEAGKRAVEDFLEKQGIAATVENHKHLGFFKILYDGDVLECRPDVGIVGGKLVDRKGVVVGGIYNRNGECPYLGLQADFSGYMHQASLMQDAEAVDIRCMKVRPELHDVFRNVTGVIYKEDAQTGCFAWKELPKDADYKELSRLVCEAARAEKYRILWNPERICKVK